jgi:hypothetical protein
MPTPPLATPFLTSIADFFAAILRSPGDLFRSWIVAIDVSVAKGIFLAYFILLIVWVLTLKRNEVTVTNERTGTRVSLRPYAVLALLSQVIIYLIF